jgi:hypothetical protein
MLIDDVTKSCLPILPLSTSSVLAVRYMKPLRVTSYSRTSNYSVRSLHRVIAVVGVP